MALKEKVIFENEVIVVKTTGRDYDFIAYVENKSDDFVSVEFTGEYKEMLEPFDVPANDWVGFLANEDGYLTLEAFEKSSFTIN